MEVWLAGGFLPLLLLAWLPAGTASRPEESVISMECRFKICSENLKVYMKCYKPAHLEESETNTMALEIDCTNLISLSICAAKMGNCVCGAYVTGMNSTDSGNGTQWTIPILSVGFNFPLCITFGLALGTLLYMPIIGLLLWQCRKNRKGKLASRQVVEGNELSMAAPVTGTEDLTYADLKFEKKGTKSASSNVIYTQIKPPRQKQRGEDAGAADAGVDASPKAEGK
ncbi:uncharacterized protein LOC129212479 isoform X5 [Grus americana]|uniref:uncharacterized protein LOC129212479 isoform X5 n=1 Tax=Grus americana TaxID=9117 RepID=UPI002407CA0A|nr:uncharacterized protein LOC129212479 isoform X5 [Grus americana]